MDTCVNATKEDYVIFVFIFFASIPEFFDASVDVFSSNFDRKMVLSKIYTIRLSLGHGPNPCEQREIVFARNLCRKCDMRTAFDRDVSTFDDFAAFVSAKTFWGIRDIVDENVLLWSISPTFYELFLCQFPCARII